jgi:lambda family phage portal protein
MRALPPKRSADPSVTVAPGSDRKIARAGKRIFQAAAGGRLENSWTSTPTSVDAWIYQHWSTLVARSREQVENNDHASKFVQLCRDNIAGPKGFTLQAAVKDPNGSPDTLASSAIEDAFARFSKKGVFDVTGTLSRADAERLICSSVPPNGEVIAVARYGRELNEFGFAVQFIDPVLLDPTHYEERANGNVIRHGIEFNANGKPVAYWFRRMDERQMGYVSGYSAQSYDIVPAENVCHIFLPEIIGQKRGLSWLRTALWRLRMLGGFEDAAIVNARVGAAKMGFFRDENADSDNDDDIPMEGDPGTFEDIGSRQLVQWNPQFPDQSIDPFTKSLLRSIASGLKVSYNNLASDLTSVNFSSIRQGALDEREVWKGLQEWLISTWCEWLYDRWLQRALLAQAITVANKPLRFERIDKYRAVTWQPRRWAWIDPASEVSANEKAIAMRIKSRSEVIRETSGRDPVDVWEETSREDKEMSALGVKPEAMPGSPGGSKPQSEEPAE